MYIMLLDFTHERFWRELSKEICFLIVIDVDYQMTKKYFEISL